MDSPQKEETAVRKDDPDQEGDSSDGNGNLNVRGVKRKRAEGALKNQPNTSANENKADCLKVILT